MVEKKAEAGFTYFDVALPSRGLPYGDKIGETVKVRLYSLTEEKMFADTREDEQNDEKLTAILSNVLKDIDANDLTLGDREFLLFWERINSYGKDYLAEVVCPICKKTTTVTIDIAELETIKLPEEYKEPFKVKLSDQNEVTLRLIRGKDELVVENYIHAMKESQWFVRYAVSIVAINGKEIDNVHEKVLFVKTLTPKEFGKIRAFHSKYVHGKDMKSKVKCSECQEVSVVGVPFQAEFFVPTRMFEGDIREDICAVVLPENESK